MKRLFAILMTIVLAASLIACSDGGSGSSAGSTAESGSAATGQTAAIRVGSKDFTESLVVGEVYALALENAGYEVERKLSIAGSVVHGAITSNEIDLYPEYTGTGLLSILKMDLVTDPDEVYRIVKEEYKKQFQISWLEPSKANDSNGIVIRSDVAEELNIHSISDLQAQSEKIRFASQGMFEQREDGIPGLEKVYGPFNFKSVNVYDNGLKYEILKNNEADAAPGYTTEGQLVNKDEFTLLEDDKNFWPPYRLTPIVRDEVLEANPGIEEILNGISEKLDTETVTSLNAKVDVDKLEYEEVAKEFFDSIK